MSLDDVMQRLHDAECDKSSLNLSKSLIRDNKIDLFSSNGHQKVLNNLFKYLTGFWLSKSKLSQFNLNVKGKIFTRKK